MLLQQAQEAIREKKFKEAADTFTNIIQDAGRKNKGIPLLSRAICYLEMGEYEKCLSDAQEIFKYPAIPSEEAYMGECYDSHSAAYFLMSQSYQKEGNQSKAEEFAEKMSESIKQNTENIERAVQIRELGNKVLKQGMTKHALQLYEQALELDPSNVAILSNLSHVHSLLNNFDKAIEMAEACTIWSPTWPKGWFRKGNALMKRGNYIEAAAAFQKGMEIAPDDPDFKRLFEEATKKAEKKPVSQGGVDKPLVGILMQIRQNSWNFKNWYNDHNARIKMWPRIFENANEHYDRYVKNDKELIDQDLNPTQMTAQIWWQKYLQPALKNSDFKKFINKLESSLQINLSSKIHCTSIFQDLVIPDEPLISMAMFYKLLKIASPDLADEWSFAWTFQAQKQSDHTPLSNTNLHSHIVGNLSKQGHGCYGVLVNGEDNIIFDFLSAWELETSSEKNQDIPKSLDQKSILCSWMFGNPSAFVYTCDSEPQFLEFLESFLKSKRESATLKFPSSQQKNTTSAHTKATTTNTTDKNLSDSSETKSINKSSSDPSKSSTLTASSWNWTSSFYVAASLVVAAAFLQSFFHFSSGL